MKYKCPTPEEACQPCSWNNLCLVKWGTRCKFQQGNKIPRIARNKRQPTIYPRFRVSGEVIGR